MPYIHFIDFCTVFSNLSDTINSATLKKKICNRYNFHYFIFGSFSFEFCSTIYGGDREREPDRQRKERTEKRETEKDIFDLLFFSCASLVGL